MSVQVIPLANRLVPFVSAARYAGVQLPPAKDRGTSTHCPFGEFAHPDGGIEKAFRVYPDHGFCFAEWEAFSPVKLYARLCDVDMEHAADDLLVHHGYKPSSYEEHWQAITGWVLPPDHGVLVQALRMWLQSRYPDWITRQYDDVVADRLAQCLGLLSYVREPQDCDYWLRNAKVVMDLAMRRAG